MYMSLDHHINDPNDHIFVCFLNQVQQVKPDVLLGLSAVGGLFSKEVFIMHSPNELVFLSKFWSGMAFVCMLLRSCTFQVIGIAPQEQH